MIKLNKRLKSLRKALSLNQESFGRRLGVTGTAISRMEIGNRTVTEQMILAICREFNVNEEWLRTGNGEMFLDFTEDEFSKAAALLSDDPFIRSLIVEYWKLDENNKKLFRDFIHKLSDNMRGLEESAVARENPLEESSLSDDDIDQAVEDYRRQLELERQATEKSEALRKNA